MAQELDFGLELIVLAGGQRKSFRDASKALNVISAGALNFNTLDPIIKRNFLKFLTALAQAMRNQHGGPWPGGTGERSLSKRTGKLVASIMKSVKVGGQFNQTSSVFGRIGSPLVYAQTQEFGKTIGVKRAKWLTIPLPAALDNRGVPKLPKARDWPNTFVQKSRRGNLLIFQRVGGRQIVPLYLLRKKVKIPPRLNLGSGILAANRALGDRIIAEALREFQAGKAL